MNTETLALYYIVISYTVGFLVMILYLINHRGHADRVQAVAIALASPFLVPAAIIAAVILGPLLLISKLGKTTSE